MADEPLEPTPPSPGEEPHNNPSAGGEPQDPPAPNVEHPVNADHEQPSHYAEPNPKPHYDYPARTEIVTPVDEEDEEGGPVKSFLEHLEDLRWVLIKIIVSVLVAMTICMIATPQIVKFLTWPLERSGSKIKLEIFGPVGGFVVSMKMAFWGGIVLSLPYILFVIGQFVMPALKKNEKPYFRKAFVIGGGLFFIGVILCYFWVMPIALSGMAEFSTWIGLPASTWRAEEYFQFVVMFLLGMGISFEIPVLVLTLVKMGIIPHEWMAKGRSYFFVANLVICAFITPDAYSTIFMVVPVQILLEICIQISAHWERKKKVEEAKRRERGEE